MEGTRSLRGTIVVPDTINACDMTQEGPAIDAKHGGVHNAGVAVTDCGRISYMRTYRCSLRGLRSHLQVSVC